MKGRPLTPEQRDHLVEVYAARGYHAAKPYAVEYGITPQRISTLARNAGHLNNHSKGARKTLNDPRWQRAISIGPVVA